MVPWSQIPLASGVLSGAPDALQFVPVCWTHYGGLPCVTWPEEGACSQGTYRAESPFLGLIVFVLHNNSSRCPGHVLFILISQMSTLSLREDKSGQSWVTRKRQGLESQTKTLCLMHFPTASCVSGFPSAWHLSCIKSTLHPLPLTSCHPQTLLISSSPSYLQQLTSPAQLKSPEAKALLSIGRRAECSGSQNCWEWQKSH